MILIANSFSGHSPKPHTKFTVHSDRERDTMSHATQADMRRDTMEQGGVHDSRFAPGLARWYIPDNLPQIFTEDHEQPPLSFAEAYGHYVTGPDGLRFWDSHWIRFYYQWVYQMKTSPLRVHSPEAADFIFVPVCLGLWCGARPTYPLYFRSDAYKWTHSQYDRSTFFFKEAPKLLPWLGKKPHVVVYNGALPSSLMQRGAVNFTFVGLETVDGMDPARFLTAPYPSHEHYDIHSQLPSLGKLQLSAESVCVSPFNELMSNTNRSMRPYFCCRLFAANEGKTGGWDLCGTQGYLRSGRHPHAVV